eukprot:364507-Chlamydomonas_euryale.AAC.11
MPIPPLFNTRLYECMRPLALQTPAQRAFARRGAGAHLLEQGASACSARPPRGLAAACSCLPASVPRRLASG